MALPAPLASGRSAAHVLADLHARLHALPAARAADPEARILHLDLHPENVILTTTGPMVIDWANATEGPSELDVAMTAVILAEVATARASPLSEPAGELLAAYLAEAGPVRSVEWAASVRAGLGPLGASRLAEATALVRQATLEAVPTPRAAAEGRTTDPAREGAGR